MATYTNDWAGPDRGHEGLWKPTVWAGVIQVVQDCGGTVDPSDFSSLFYTKLNADFSSIAWYSTETNGQNRSLFRDAREAWTTTQVLDFGSKTISTTPRGLAVLSGELSYGDALVDAFLSFKEPDSSDNPFAIICECMLSLPIGNSVTAEDVIKIMRHYRPGTADDLAHVLNGESITTSGATERRVKFIMTLLTYAGAVVQVGKEYFLASRCVAKEIAKNLPRSKSRKKSLPPTDGHYQTITYGAPGTGKSFKIKDETVGEMVFRTTFHPDSDYAMFVGAYKPIMKPVERTALVGKKLEIADVESVKEDLKKEKVISYEFVEQVFTKAYIQAWACQKTTKDGEPLKRVYLVIEEINRGNCAQVFGDLFQLLDRKPNGFSDYAIKPDSDFGNHIRVELQKVEGPFDTNRKAAINELYPEVEDGIDVVDEVLAGRLMLLPDNLYIRATMNTSDQSLFPMDSAFRRRWDWDYVAIKNHPEEDWKIEIDAATHYGWWDFLEAINKEIFKATSAEDKQLGYYFVRAPDKKIDLNMFVNKVVFYLWNSVFKDCYTDCEFMKQDKDRYFTFTGFFKDGTLDAGQAKAFLGKLDGLKSLQEKNAEKAKATTEASNGVETTEQPAANA